MKAFAIRIGVLVLALIPGVGRADEAAELRPEGKVRVQFKGEVREADTPLTLSLAPGDQLCVLQGRARLVLKDERRLGPGECFQVPAPRSVVQSFAQFVQGLFARPRSATATTLQSRGGECEQAPAVHLPRSFALPELLVPASGRPNPKTLKLLDAAGEEVYRLESGEDRAVFAVPGEALAKASRLQILNSRGQVLYAGDIFRVEFAEPLPQDPREAAMTLLATGLTDYAHAAYSLLVSAGAAQEAKSLEEQIRVSFACGS